MRRGSIIQRISPLLHYPCGYWTLCGITLPFERLSPSVWQVPHVLLTRPPLNTRRCLARLACVKHAASVCPEPGSNSHIKSSSLTQSSLTYLFFFCSILKVLAASLKRQVLFYQNYYILFFSLYPYFLFISLILFIPTYFYLSYMLIHQVMFIICLSMIMSINQYYYIAVYLYSL